AAAAQATRPRLQAARPAFRRADGFVLRDGSGPDGDRGDRRDARADAGQRTGQRFHEMADGQTLHELAGVVPQLQEDGRQGAVESYAARQGPRRARAAAGGVEPDAEQGGAGGVPAPTAGAAGSAEGDNGDGAQVGANRVPPDAFRRGLRQTDGGGVRRASASTPGETVAASRQGAGIRADQTRGKLDSAGGRSAGGIARRGGV